jgi:hypothetical protein
MGYTTEFTGSISVEPPLNAEEISYLTKFSESRRMDGEQGPYFVGRSGYMGQGNEGVRDYNRPPPGQPGLWCQWVPTPDGAAIEWNGAEKFYDSAEWMKYIIDHFIKPGALAKSELPFLQANHVCNGVIEAQGEEYDDRWSLVVENNKVKVASGQVVYGDPQEI